MNDLLATGCSAGHIGGRHHGHAAIISQISQRECLQGNLGSRIGEFVICANAVSSVFCRVIRGKVLRIRRLDPLVRRHLSQLRLCVLVRSNVPTTYLPGRE